VRSEIEDQGALPVPKGVSIGAWIVIAAVAVALLVCRLLR
jgi:hypothetical protein